VLGFILAMIVIGIVAGYVARLLVPGRDPMSFLQTMLLGVVGSFVGGFLGYALLGKDIEEGAFQASGFLGAIIGAVLVLLLWHAATNGRGGRGWSRRGWGRRI
jgi:uncharacterized membrane protein YeaQ/YmgE (transglycosylase-associated protein family)